MTEREELVFARQFTKFLDKKTMGTGKWMDLAYQFGLKACCFIKQLVSEIAVNEQDSISLLTDIRKVMISDAETIAGEFSGGKKWDEYCKDTKALIDRIGEMVLKLKG